MYNSVGGGTGSGLGSLLLERLSADYGKKQKMTFNVYPSAETSTSVLEPYNSVFATHYSLEHADITFYLDNAQLYSIC